MAPQRTCIGCRRKLPADAMVRVVRLGDGTLATGRMLPGRGAWLCLDAPGCVEMAQKRRAFERAFRAHVDAGVVEDLKLVLSFPPESRT